MLSGKEDPYYTMYNGEVPSVLIAGTLKEEIQRLDPDLQEVYNRWRKPPRFELYDLQNDP
jgi:N-sulfoglucosamine sulfohydrolase